MTADRRSARPGPAGRPARTAWPAVAALAAATLLFWMSLYLYVPFLPGYSRGLGASATWIGVITGSYGFAQLLLRLPVGVWSDRLARRKPFVLAGCGFAMLSGLAFAAAGEPVGLLAGRALGGVAATMWLAFTVLYTSYFPGATGSAMAAIVAVNNAGVVVGQVVGPLLAGRLGEPAVFWIAALVGAAALALAWLAPDRRTAAHTVPSLRALSRVAANRRLLTVSLLAAVAQYLIHGGAFVFVYDWAQQRLQASPEELGLLAAYAGAPAAVAALAGGTWMARRWGARRVVVAGFVVAGVTMAVVPLLGDMAALYWTQALGGVARGLTVPVLMGMALQTVPAEQGATAIGFFQATYAVGMTAGPILTGVIGDTAGLAGGFALMGALALAGAAATRLALPGGRWH